MRSLAGIVSARLVSKGTFPLMGQIHPVNFKIISQSIQKLLSRNKIQNRCHVGHIEKAAMMIIEINLPHERSNTLLSISK
jgi:hypothetical protein